MTQATKAVADGTNNTANLEIYLDNVLITTFNYNGVLFTLSPRPTVTTVNRPDFVGNVEDIVTWHTSLEKWLTLNYSFKPHFLRINDHTNTTRFRLEFGAIMAIDALVNKPAQTTEFQARLALTLSPEEFRRFLSVLQRILGLRGSSPWIAGIGA